MIEITISENDDERPPKDHDIFCPRFVDLHSQEI